ncbi:MAG: AAA family ATPase [Symbiobacteriaceae bacterium]|nr:MAG: sporulation initiation inhibitor Soj [Bacillota bacterium]
MGRVIAIANQKGGVGKTTTTVNLGACLAAQGRRVLVIDIDPQANTTSGFGLDKNRVARSIYDVLIEERSLREVIRSTAVQGLWLVPANIELAGAELELVGMAGREKRLRRALEGVRDGYDYVLIDCPPSLGLLTLNAMTAADGLIVPIQCEYYALEGLTQLLNTLRAVQAHLNPDLELDGVVLTMFDGRTNLSIQVVEEVKRFFRDKVFRTIIPRNVRLSEAPSHGQPVILYDARSRGAEVYTELAKEVMAYAEEQARAG